MAGATVAWKGRGLRFAASGAGFLGFLAIGKYVYNRRCQQRVKAGSAVRLRLGSVSVRGQGSGVECPWSGSGGQGVRDQLLGAGFEVAGPWCQAPSAIQDPRNRNRPTPSATGHQSCDVLVVGGGIVGLAVARELSLCHPKLTVYVADKEKEVCSHQSSHNSGVIHSGLYYRPGTDRAKCCVEGAKLMRDYCDHHGLPINKCGKLVVAVKEEELDPLRSLFERGLENQVPGIEMVDQARISELEPACTGLAAIWVPSTAVTDFQKVAQQYQRDFMGINLRNRVITGFEAGRFSPLPSYAKWTYGRIWDGESRGVVVQDRSNVATITAKRVITCCGLQADKVLGPASAATPDLGDCDLRPPAVACKLGGGPEPSILSFRGTYLRLKADHENLVTRCIYPVPDARFPFLGIHFTPAPPVEHGEVTVGPSAIMGFAREGYHYYDINVAELAEFLTNPAFWKLAWKYFGFGARQVAQDVCPSYSLKTLQSYIPELKSAMLERSSHVGVRSQAMFPDGQLCDDFVFEDKDIAAPFDGLVLNVRNAASPAATASMAIAKIPERFQVVRTRAE
eukprot:gene7040-1258_t